MTLKRRFTDPTLVWHGGHPQTPNDLPPPVAAPRFVIDWRSLCPTPLAPLRRFTFHVEIRPLRKPGQPAWTRQAMRTVIARELPMAERFVLDTIHAEAGFGAHVARLIRDEGVDPTRRYEAPIAPGTAYVDQITGAAAEERALAITKVRAAARKSRRSAT